MVSAPLRRSASSVSRSRRRNARGRLILHANSVPARRNRQRLAARKKAVLETKQLRELGEKEKHIRLTQNQTFGQDPTKQWHGQDPILRRLRLKDLQRHGYIDWKEDEPLPSLSFASPSSFVQSGRARLHPIFKPNNWDGLAAGDFKLLLPAMQIASHLLAFPPVLAFFSGLFRRPHKELVPAYNPNLKFYRFDTISRPDPSLPDPYNPHPPPETDDIDTYRIDAPGRQELVRTCRTILAMSKVIRLNFDNTLRASVAGRTQPRNNAYGLIPNVTHACLISFNEEFRQVLRGTTDNTMHAKAAHFSRDAALFRTQLMLAITMLHEIAHAAWRATDPRLPDIITSPPETYREPFYANHRVAELGNAITQVIFDGNPTLSGRNPASMSGPYGVQIHDFPGALHYMPFGMGKAAYERGSPTHFGAWRQLFGPVHMVEVAKFFERKFWEFDTQRWGFMACRIGWGLVLEDRNVSTYMYAGEKLRPTETTNRGRPKFPQNKRTLEVLGFKMKVEYGETSSEDEDEDEDEDGIE